MGRPKGGMGSLEDHKGFGALHPSFWWREPPLCDKTTLQIVTYAVKLKSV